MSTIGYIEEKIEREIAQIIAEVFGPSPSVDLATKRIMLQVVGPVLWETHDNWAKVIYLKKDGKET